VSDSRPVYLTIAQASRLLSTRKLSPVELTRAVLDQARAVQPITNAFITFLEEQAMAEARQAEQAIARGEYLGPLHGIPVSVKDIFDVKGQLTTCGSAVLHDNVATRDATAVRRLAEAGAILVGKTNMTEFAVDVPSPVYGPVRNPRDPDRSAGLSSSGSGAAVLTGASFVSLGTDTGGSIRLPAAFSGCVGIKPTYGRVSRHGVFPLSWTLDHAGPLTRTVADAAVSLRAIAGYDPNDRTSSERRVPNYGRGINKGLIGLKVGVPKEYFFDVQDQAILPFVRAAIDRLAELGAEVLEVSTPHVAESSRTVSAFIRAEQASAHGELLRTRLHLYSRTLADRLVAASVRPAVTYIDAQRERTRVIDDLQAALRGVDVIVTPSTPILPYKLEEQQFGVDWKGASLSWFTSPFNLSGLPAISLPCGFTESGLPVGLQIAGPAFGEALILRVARAYEASTDWHKRLPEV
jgi:aspartyl-tRNA(Asn)/glutamyl-tRNA(Gln) amidotransferase subunit A